MSYVLEALRRAEAERARGDLPGLHAQPIAPVTAAPTPAAPARPSRRLAAVAAVAVLSAVAATLAVTGWRPAGGPPAPRSAGGDPIGTVPPSAMAPPAAAALPPPTVAAPPPAPVPAAAPPPPPLASTLPATASVPPRPVVREAPAPAPATMAAPAAPVTPARVPRLAELPAALRQQLPPLAFGGATDSTVPSARMLLINGQVFREGDEVAPGLRLEQIRLRTAQMRWRDQPFEVAY